MKFTRSFLRFAAFLCNHCLFFSFFLSSLQLRSTLSLTSSRGSDTFLVTGGSITGKGLRGRGLSHNGKYYKWISKILFRVAFKKFVSFVFFLFFY